MRHTSSSSARSGLTVASDAEQTSSKLSRWVPEQSALVVLVSAFLPLESGRRADSVHAVMYSLVFGEAGPAKVAETLMKEVGTNMRLLGAQTVNDLKPHLVRARQSIVAFSTRLRASSRSTRGR